MNHLTIGLSSGGVTLWFFVNLVRVNRFFILGDADVDIWIFKDYITACAEQFPVTSIETIILLDKSVIEILHEIDYWKKFKEEQAIELFKAFDNSRMLPEKIRDLFVF